MPCLAIIWFLFLGDLKPIDMKGDYLLLPLAVVGDQGFFYVLDKKAKKIFAYDQNQKRHSFGRAGQGPGEFNTPASMAMGGNLLFCLERFSGRVSVFDKKGHFKRDFKLQSPEGLVHAGAIALTGQHVLISYNNGPDLLKVFHRDGELIQTVKSEELFSYPVSKNFEMHLVPSKDLLIVYSRFDGLIFLVSLHGYKIVDIIVNRFPSLEEKIGSITDSVMKIKKKNHITSFNLFFNLIVDQEEFISIYGGEKFVNGYRFDRFPYGAIEAEEEYRISFEQVPNGVRFIKELGGLLVIIDKEGQIYTTQGLF